MSTTDRRSVTARVVSSATALAARTLWERLATLAATLVVARLLTPEDFGTAALVIAVGAVALTVVDAGMTTSLVRAAEAPSARQLAIARRIQLCLGGLLLLAAAAAVLVDAPSAPLLLLVCAKLPLRPLTLRVRVALQRSLDFRGLALAEAIGLLVQSVCAVAIASVVQGPAALVASDVLGAFAAAAWIAMRLGAAVPLPPGGDQSASGWSVLRDALPCSGYALVATSREFLTSLLVGALLGVRALGLLQFASRVLSPVLVIFAAVAQLAVPLGRAVMAGDARARDRVREGFRVAGLLAAMLLASVAASAEWLVPLAFGHQWDDAVPAIVVIAGALVLSGPLNAFGLGMLVAAGRTALASALVMGSGLTFAVAAVALEPHGGVGAGAAAWLSMAVVEALTVGVACRRVLDLELGWATLQPVVVFVASTGAGLAASWLTPAGSGLLLPAAVAATAACATAASATILLARHAMLDFVGAARAHKGAATGEARQ